MNDTNAVEIRGEKMAIEKVTKPSGHYKGLSNRDYLCWDCGMLFVFPRREVREFVMRDMNFALDIIFITDNKIIRIAEKLRPEGEDPLAVYSSMEPVDLVLEVNGGYCEDKGIEVGDVIKLK